MMSVLNSEALIATTEETLIIQSTAPSLWMMAPSLSVSGSAKSYESVNDAHIASSRAFNGPQNIFKSNHQSIQK